MLLQHRHHAPSLAPFWQANYKSMAHAQLVRELARIVKRPRFYSDCIERKAFIATELALKAGREPATQIILSENDEPRKETKMALTIVDGPTIPHNESLSDGVDCSAGTIVRITVPQEFTPANLTFQSSSDGNLYNDLYDASGEEITMVAKPDTTIIVAAPWARSLGFIKIRSGTRDFPVAQTRDTVKFGIAVEVPEMGGAGADPASRRA